MAIPNQGGSTFFTIWHLGMGVVVVQFSVLSNHTAQPPAWYIYDVVKVRKLNKVLKLLEWVTFVVLRFLLEK